MVYPSIVCFLISYFRGSHFSLSQFNWLVIYQSCKPQGLVQLVDGFAPHTIDQGSILGSGSVDDMPLTRPGSG